MEQVFAGRRRRCGGVDLAARRYHAPSQRKVLLKEPGGANNVVPATYKKKRVIAAPKVEDEGEEKATPAAPEGQAEQAFI